MQTCSRGEARSSRCCVRCETEYWTLSYEHSPNTLVDVELTSLEL